MEVVFGRKDIRDLRDARFPGLPDILLVDISTLFNSINTQNYAIAGKSRRMRLLLFCFSMQNGRYLVILVKLH